MSPASGIHSVSKKRKQLPSNSLIPPRKRPKTAHSKSKTNQYRSLDELPWKPVSRPQETGFEDDGMLMLEEIEGVEVVYGDDQDGGGRVVKFNIRSEGTILGDQEKQLSSGEGSDGEDNELDAQAESSEPSETLAEIEENTARVEVFDTSPLLPSWSKCASTLHPTLLHALLAQKFTTPMPIQSTTLPLALSGRDVVGVAETGSGKTLAYGLPILHHLLSHAHTQNLRLKIKRKVQALVLAPTRELALQVAQHLNLCLSTSAPGASAESMSGGSGSKKPPLVSIAAIVGGMSAQKQRRLLDRGVDILVCTPGRLWDILSEDDELAREIRSLRFLVLDEADRMVEAGHFAELDNILRLTLRGSSDEAVGEDEENGQTHQNNDKLQTFVFSATLSKDLQRNLTKRSSSKRPAKSKAPASTLDELLLRLDFRDPHPEVVDLSPEGGVVSTLKEAKIECLTTDKDVHLYYFLLRYPGRSLVFLSSIDGIRRLLPLMDLLGLKAFPLHSQLEQKQRLKNLDRFKSIPHAILLATDIAARGLDIPLVDHVIHYQIPRSADTYVHRNGRTARARRSGFSMLMCAPDERKLVRGLMSSLGRQDGDIPDIAIERDLLDKLKARILLARKVDNAQHKIKKTNHERNWMKETAEALEVELDSDLASDSDNNAQGKKKTQDAKTAALKSELKQLLSEPLIARGVSTRYITSGSRLVIDDLLREDHHATMLGVKKAQPGTDILPAKKRRPKETAAHEEWSGFTT